MSWNAEKEREYKVTLARYNSLKAERDAFMRPFYDWGIQAGPVMDRAADIVALLSSMVEAKVNEGIADPSDPHAALRASYRPGQKWEWFSGQYCQWLGVAGEPSWDVELKYRLAEDQL